MGLDDVTGDGIRDFAVGATYYWGMTGYVRLYSGATHLPVLNINGLAMYSEFGTALAQSEDLDGDGRADLLVGAPRLNGGSVHAFSSASGAALWSSDCTAPGGRFGTSLARIGDIDGDGLEDVLVGAPGASICGEAYVISAADGTVLRTLSLPAASAEFGQSVATLGDLDGDGKPEFAIGAPGLDSGAGADSGACFVHDGARLGLLYRCDGQSAGSRLGFSVAGAGDIDADGRLDFLAGAPEANGGGRTRSGTAFAYCCSRLALHADTLELSAERGGRVDFRLDAGVALAAQPYVLLGSMSGSHPGIPLGTTTLPLNVDGFTTLVLQGLNTPVFRGFTGVLDAAGMASASFDTLGPFDPFLLGTQTRFAFVDYSFTFASNALPVELVE